MKLEVVHHSSKSNYCKKKKELEDQEQEHEESGFLHLICEVRELQRTLNLIHDPYIRWKANVLAGHLPKLRRCSRFRERLELDILITTFTNLGSGCDPARADGGTAP